MESDGEDLENIFDEYENNEGETGTENIENNTADETPGAVKIAAPKRIVKNPRLKFNAERLCGERGIPVLIDHFKDVKFKGSGHEKEDLDKLLSKLEHWTHRLFPSMKFEDCLVHIEKLGKKRPVQTCLRKIRLDMPILNSDFVKDNEEDDVKRHGDSEPEIMDDFDRLLGESREISSIDESAPENAPNSSSFYSSPMLNETSTAHVLGSSFGSSLTDEQKERMERNKMLAAERRKARLAAMEQNSTTLQSDETTVPKNVPAEQTSFDKLFGSSECNEETAENNKSGLEMGHDFDESSENQSNLNDDNSEKLGLDDLMNLVDEEDSIPEGNTISSSPQWTESVSANINEISDDAENCNMSALKSSKRENFPTSLKSGNSPKENLDVKSSLDLICETPVDSRRNATLKSMPISDENANSTSVDWENENCDDDGIDVNEINKCSSDNVENFKTIEEVLENTSDEIPSSPKIAEKIPEENLNVESSLDLVEEMPVISEINTNVDSSVKDSSVSGNNVIIENDNMDCEDENF